MCTVEDEPDPEGMLNGSDLEDMSGVRIHKLSTATPNYPTHSLFSPRRYSDHRLLALDLHTQARLHSQSIV